MAEETIKHNEIIEENVFAPAATSADILLGKLNELIKSFKDLATLTGKKVPLTDPKTLDEAQQIAVALEKIKNAEKGLTEIQKVQIQAQAIVNKQKKEFRESLKAETSAYQALQNQYSAAAQKAKDLAASQGLGSKASKEASKEANTLNQKLKDIDASMGQNSRSVGDYGKALSGTPFGGFITGIGNIGKAFLTNPIGLIITAIVSAFAALKKAFESTEEGQDKMAKGFAIISNVVGSLFKLIQPLANFLFDKVVGAFEAVGSAAGVAGRLIADALAVFGFDAAAKSVNNFIDSTTKAAAAGAKIAEMRDKADDIERELIVERAKLEARIADAKQKAADTENVSASERKKAIEEAIKLTNELANKEEERATLLVNAKKLENEQTGATEEDKKELAELEAALFTIQRNRSQDILALQKAEKKGNREIIAQQKELAKQQKDAQDAADKRLKKEMDNLQTAADERNKKAEELKDELEALDKADKEAFNAAAEKEAEKQKKAAEDAAKKSAEEQKKIQETVFDALEKGLQKQSDRKQEFLDNDIKQREDNIDRQRDLAERGLENTLAFEEAQKAKAELAREQEKKREIRSQKAIAFLRLVAGYAEKDPGTAISKAIADIAIASLIEGSFAEGVEGIQGEGTETSDSILARLSKNESVITAKATRENAGLPTAMNEGRVDDYFMNNYLPKMAIDGGIVTSTASNIHSSMMLNQLIGVSKRLEGLEKAIINKRETNTNIDNVGNVITTDIENGFKKVVIKMRKRPMI